MSRQTVEMDDEVETETHSEEENSVEAVASGEGETVAENSDSGEQADADAPEDDETDDVIVTIEGESPAPEEKATPKWVKDLRRQQRELQRENRELKAKLQAPAIEIKATDPGKKPKLEDHDYDADAYEAAIDAWHAKKKAHDAEVAKAEAAQKEQAAAWQAKLDNYGKLKGELKVRDFEESEHAVQELFNVTQQGIMLQGAENPALVVYALGKSPNKAKELASINDPVKFAFAVAKLESNLKVTDRKASPPPPEKTVRGSGPVGSGADSTLERLRAEADKTGDRSKVSAYLRQRKLSGK